VSNGWRITVPGLRPSRRVEGALVIRPFQAATGLRNARSRKNGIDTHS